MAWIISATNRGLVANRHLKSLQVALLVAHLTMLIGLLIDRPTADAAAGRNYYADANYAASLPGASSNSATFALGTGILLALLMLASGRARSNSQFAPAGEPLPLVHASPTARPSVPVAIASHEGLLARLNHDLRTPLNALIGFADLMKSETFGPLGHDKYRAYADHMQACGQDLLRATESTLAMASMLTAPGDHNDDIVDLASIVDDAWTAATAARIGSPLDTFLDTKSDRSIRVRCHLPAIRQSLVHLFELACERGCDGATVEFTAQRSHGRVDACIRVNSGIANKVPRTGCRTARGTDSGVDELALGVSRALLELHGVPLVETANGDGQWAVTMTFEDAAQADFFEAATRGDHTIGGRPIACWH